MRTMLIPTILLLFCSLTQLANAVPTPLADCKTIYKCFVPVNCYQSYDTANAKDKEIQELDNDRTVNDDCPALFRFHTFLSHKAQVSIMSFVKDVTTIEFSQVENPVNGVTPVSKFSCSGDKGKYIGRRGTEVTVEDLTDDYTRGIDGRVHLRCTFILSLPKKTESIFAFLTSTIQFKIEKKDGTTVNTKKQIGRPLNPGTYMCDLTSLQFNNKKDTYQKFAVVLSKPHELFCKEDDLFKMMYKKNYDCDDEKKDDCYFEVNTQECQTDNDFYINGQHFKDKGLLDIRCVAEVKYFCDHDIVNKVGLEKYEIDLHKEKAKKNPNTPSVLKCPDDHPYLFVDGKLIMKPEFECRNYGATEYWTVLEEIKNKDGTTEKKPHRLTPKGPVAYCSSEISCELKYSIPDRAVDRGMMENYLPVCMDDKGWLEVGNVKIDNNKVQCNRVTGDFFYTINSAVQVVTPETKFVCKYPIIMDDEKNEQDKMTLIIAGGVGITMCIALVVGAVIAAVIMSKKHIKKMNAKREKDAIELFKRNEMGYNEFVKKDDDAAVPAEAPSADPTSWNEPIMDFRCTSEKFTSINNPHTLHTTEVPAADLDNAELYAATKNRKLMSNKKLVGYTKKRSIPRSTIELNEFETTIKVFRTETDSTFDAENIKKKKAPPPPQDEEEEEEEEEAK